MARGLELGTETSPQQELLEEVAEARYGNRWRGHQTRRLATEAERTEVQREL